MRAFVAGRLSWAVALLLAACQPSPQSALDDARRLLGNGQQGAAVLTLKSLLQAQPDLAEARLLLGTSLLAEHQAAAAEAELQRALALHAPPEQVVPALARAQLAQGRHEALVAAWRHTRLSNASAQADLQTSLGEALLARGEPAAAQAVLAQALNAAPAFVPAQLLQARLEAQAGQPAQALRRVDAVLEVIPGSAEALALKAGLLVHQGQPTLALPLYQKALQIDPGLVAAHAALVGLQLGQRDTAAASASLAAMHKAWPEHPQTRWLSVQVALARGELAQADAQLQLLLKAAPDNVVLLQAAGATALRLDRPAQAERQLARALQLAPEAAGVRRLLAQTQMAQGQTARALDTLAPQLLAGSTDAAALALAAQARLLMDQRTVALALFDRAAALAPDDVQLRTARAVAQLAQADAGAGSAGQRAGADPLARGLAELQAVARTDSGTSADVALVTAQLQARRWDAALAAVDALARKLPDRPLPAMLRGQVLLARQDRAGARAAFEQALARDPGHLPAAAALGRLDQAEQQPGRAKARFERMLQAAADQPAQQSALRLALADLLARSGAPADAVRGLLAEAVKASPADLAVQLALVDHHLAERDGRSALQAARAAAALAPDEPELLLRLGRSQLLAGEPRQAASSFSRLSTQQPGLLAGWQGLIDAQLASQDLSAAAATARRAVGALPQSVAAQRLAIVVALRQKQPEAAVAVARQVQAQRPEEAVGWLLEGEVQINQQQWPAAVAALRQGLAKRAPGQTPARLHHALARSGDAAAAAALAQRWTRAHPEDLLFQHHLGDQALARRDWPQALQHYQAVLAAQPEHGVALNNVAWVMLQQGRPGALALAQRAVRALPGQAGPLDTLGAALAAAGQLGPAVAAVQQASALAPGDGALHLHLARLYQRSGQLDDAAAQAERALAAGGSAAQQAEARALKAELAAR